MFYKKITVVLFLIISTAFAQQVNRVDLGKLQSGEIVSFHLTSDKEWGIEISGGSIPVLTQPKPAIIEVFKNENDIYKLSAGYKNVRKANSNIVARAEISCENVVFHVEDNWSMDEAVVSIKRKIEIKGNAEGGFNSSVLLTVDPSVNWKDVNCLAPGAMYGDPAYNGDRSIGGKLNYTARRFLIREDMLPAPLIALSFTTGSSVSMLDPSPRGESTVEETRLLKDVMTDSRFQFGSFGMRQAEAKPIEFGFQFPGAMSLFALGPNASETPRWIRRYHPITQGVTHNYEIKFRFGKDESFCDVTKNSWRWAWSIVKPEITPIDVEQMRTVLIDHLAAQAATIEGRSGIPFAIATYDTNQLQWNWTMTAMGFVSKNIECADQLLRESDRDNTERGQKMRGIGLSIISSMIQALSSIPLQATGYDLATGKPWTGERQEWLAPWLRNATEDMIVLMKAYRRECALGRQHPEWFNWVKSYMDWLIP